MGRSGGGRVGILGWAILALGLAAAGAMYFAGAGTGERAGPFRVAYANEAPYGYLDPATGRVTGEAPEIARVLLRRVGIEDVEMVVTEFGSLIPGLKAGRFDMVAAGMYITPERCREIAFSRPTYAIGEAFLVAGGNPLDLHSFEDVAAHGTARIGVMGGAVEHGYARALGVPEERIVIFPDYPSALAGLGTDRIDALAATDLTASDLLAKAPVGIERAEPFRDPVIDGKPAIGYGAFGFRKEDAELVARIDAELERFLGTAEHLGLVRPFGFSEETLPGGMTAASLCGGR